MTTRVIGDTTVTLGRSVRHVTRSLDTIITVTVMPIAFLLLFRYVFGGAIQAGADKYVKRHAKRHLRAVPLHADRTIVHPLGTRADLAGVQRHLRGDHPPRGAPHGLPVIGRSAGLARRHDQ